MAKSWKPTEKDVVPIHPLSLLSKLVQTLGILHATIKDAFQKLGFVTEMMIALTIPMKIKIAPLLPVPVRISDAPPADVFPIHSVVMVTMTAETDLVSVYTFFCRGYNISITILATIPFKNSQVYYRVFNMDKMNNF